MFKVRGIHHITAITSDLQKNLNFYEGFLGQKLVKRTVNFDDPSSYHLYYGDEVGTPGTLLTFFYWPAMNKAKHGVGEVSAVFYAIKDSSYNFWKKRAVEFGIEVNEEVLPFGEKVLVIHDPDGIKIGLVVAEVDSKVIAWKKGPVPVEHVLLGFYGALLLTHSKQALNGMLTEAYGYSQLRIENGITRYQTDFGWPGKYLAIKEDSTLTRADLGSGSIHHIAFQVENDEELIGVQQQIFEAGFNPTTLIDRQYFHSVYCMSPGAGVFEVATNDIGITFDEEVAELGVNLKLPPQYENDRDFIEARLEPIILPRNSF